MATPADKIMFEIYREAGYDLQYRVVYFTELDDHNKESEINRAMAGEHFLDGFISERSAAEAKAAIDDLLARLNGGEELSTDSVHQELTRRGLLVS